MHVPKFVEPFKINRFDLVAPPGLPPILIYSNVLAAGFLVIEGT
jgi:hypothetical protein